MPTAPPTAATLMQKPFTAIHQKVVVEVDMDQELVWGYTEITLNCLEKQTKIELNARNLEITKVLVNQLESNFSVTNSLKETFEKVEKVSSEAHSHAVHFISTFREEQRLSSFDPELSIFIPESIKDELEFIVKIYFNLEGSQYGAHFSEKGSLKQMIFGNGSFVRYSFPCFDTEKIVSLWDLEFILPLESKLTVISNGESKIKKFLKAEKISHKFHLKTLVCARMIGAVIGTFEEISLSPTRKVYFPPSKQQKATHTTLNINKIFDFYHWFLNGLAFPFEFFNLVFALEPSVNFIDSAGLFICNSSLLTDSNIIDDNFELRTFFCQAIARQYFGVYLTAVSSCDLWIIFGLSGYLSMQCFKSLYGNNEFKFLLRKQLQLICELDINKQPLGTEFNLFDQETFDFKKLKSVSVIFALEQNLSKAFLQKILVCILEERQVQDNQYFHKLIKNTTGKDLKTFFDYWVFGSGLPTIFCSFSLNRKKNTIELVLKQRNQSLDLEAIQKFTGPLTIRIHEADGIFDHVVQLEDYSQTIELAYHTRFKKSRRKKKTEDGQEENIEEEGEDQTQQTRENDEIDDEDLLSINSPISWVRVDPEGEWLMNLSLDQPDFMWIDQLENDKDIVAQYEAVIALEKFPSEASCFGLERVLKDPRTFYRIRVEVAFTLSSCATKALNYIGAHKLISIFSKKFCVQESKIQNIIKPNNFEQLFNYFVQKAIPRALSLCGQVDSCPAFCVQFILSLLKCNDNSKNIYSDSYYVSTLIESLANSIVSCKDLEKEILEDCLEEIERYRILDLMFPSYQNAVSVACIKSFTVLNLNSITRISKDFFILYTKKENFIDVRLAAFDALGLLYSCFDLELLLYLIETFKFDGTYLVRTRVLNLLNQLTRSEIFHFRNFLILNSSVKNILWEAIKDTCYPNNLELILNLIEYSFPPMDNEPSPSEPPCLILPNQKFIPVLEPEQESRANYQYQEPIIPKLVIPVSLIPQIPKIVLPKLSINLPVTPVKIQPEPIVVHKPIKLSFKLPKREEFIDLTNDSPNKSQPTFDLVQPKPKLKLKFSNPSSINLEVVDAQSQTVITENTVAVSQISQAVLTPEQTQSQPKPVVKSIEPGKIRFKIPLPRTDTE